MPHPHIAAANVQLLRETESGNDGHLLQNGPAERRVFHVIRRSDAFVAAQRVQMQSTSAGALADFQPGDVPGGLLHGLQVFVRYTFPRSVVDDRIKVVAEPSRAKPAEVPACRTNPFGVLSKAEFQRPVAALRLVASRSSDCEHGTTVRRAKRRDRSKCYVGPRQERPHRPPR